MVIFHPLLILCGDFMYIRNEIFLNVQYPLISGEKLLKRLGKYYAGTQKHVFVVINYAEHIKLLRLYQVINIRCHCFKFKKTLCGKFYKQANRF